MEKRLDRMERKIDDIYSEVHKSNVSDATRLAKLETTQRGFITIFTAILTAITGFLIKQFYGK